MIELAPGERLVVLAGNYRQAVAWAQEKGLDIHRIIWPRDPSDLRGLPRGMRYVRVGTYWEQRDGWEMLDMLVYREAVEVNG